MFGSDLAVCMVDGQMEGGAGSYHNRSARSRSRVRREKKKLRGNGEAVRDSMNRVREGRAGRFRLATSSAIGRANRLGSRPNDAQYAARNRPERNDSATPRPTE